MLQGAAGRGFTRRRAGGLLAAVPVLARCQVSQDPGAPLRAGLIAPVSGVLAPSGVAIQRGMLLAADEVNGGGGVLGRPLSVVVRDVPNDPRAGVAALRELVEQQQIVAVFGGIYSPVMLGQLETLHQLRVPLINAWGSVTGITRNGFNPNFAFRVSVSDESAGEFLVRYALEVVGARRVGIIADTTAWGDSNVAGLTQWLQERARPPLGVERFDQGETNMSRQLRVLQREGVDALLLVANAPEGAAIVRGLNTLDWRPAVVSHWGISGGQFVQLAGSENAEGVFTLQTYSFMGELPPRGQALLRAYHARFGTRRAEEVQAPVGVVHGYDGMHLLARALQLSGSTDGARVRDALERLPPHDGLLKRYAPAFTPERHDALTADDYLMTVWRDGRLLPAKQPRLSRS
jgi:branched-chain amino acid transport system substrate-binding protein